MKKLKPSHRERKRYLLIQGKDISKENINKSILEFVGVLGFAEASPKIIKETNKQIILAINRESLEKVRTSFLMSGKDLNIVKVSGMIGKLEE